MIQVLLDLLSQKKLQFKINESNSNAFIIEFDVWAKPGAKVEKNVISPEGALIIQTRAKPIEGEANSAICETVGKIFGVAKSQVEIIRGEKSKHKRIKLMVEITANKNVEYFQKKIISI